MNTSEFLLASGFFCAALAAGLCQFVMIGLIGVGLFPLAFILLLCAGAHTQAVAPVSFWQRGAGLVYIMGVLVLLVLAGYASSLAFTAATNTAASRVSEWGLLALMSVAPTTAISVGLRFRTEWSWRYCTIWGIVAWAVLPTAVMIFRILTPVLPLKA